MILDRRIKEYIKVQEKRKGVQEDILEMDSIYFLCNVETENGERNLDEYEKFKGVEFDSFRSQAGSNAFTLSPHKWLESTDAIGMVSRSGRYG